MTGDWYPLLPYTTKPTEWMAVQYHRSDLDEGMVLAFRHPESPYPAADVALRALDPGATYTLSHDTSGKVVEVKGSDLRRALRLTLSEKRSSELIVYRRRG